MSLVGTAFWSTVQSALPSGIEALRPALFVPRLNITSKRNTCILPLFVSKDHRVDFVRKQALPVWKHVRAGIFRVFTSLSATDYSVSVPAVSRSGIGCGACRHYNYALI